VTAPSRILVIHNPTAGRRRQRFLDAVLSRLRAAGCDVTTRATQRAGDGERLARAASSEAFDLVVAAGGDGTINEVLNGLAGQNTPLGLIPVGTANVLAAELDFPETAEGLADMLRRGRTRRVYPGVVSGRRFATVAGVGFDAQVVANVRLGLKRWLGKGAYVWQYIAEMVWYRPRIYQLAVDGVVYGAAGAIISNARFYAGRFICTPDARLTDPCFHVCMFHTASRFAIIRYGLALLIGRINGLADVTVVPGTRLRIANGAGAPVQADGDIVASLPVEIATVTEGIEVVAP
jgi:YegS/Rv2252/BmrU family lipid kinase